MSKLLTDMRGNKCKFVILGIYEIKGTIIDIDDEWIKFKYSKKEKIKLIRRRFVSSVILL